MVGNVAAAPTPRHPVDSPGCQPSTARARATQFWSAVADWACVSRGPTQTTDGEAPLASWSGHPHAARVVQVGVGLLPLLLSIAFSVTMSQFFPPHRVGLNKWVWWLALIGVTSLLLSRLDRIVRRLAPLPVLLRLSLVFPDEAPSRFKTSMRSFSARKVQSRLDGMRKAGFVLNNAENRSQTMLDLVAMLSDHDRLTRGHSERVRAYSEMIGRELGLPDADIEKLQWASLLHDLGKLTVPQQILNKPGRPDDNEWRILAGHPAAGIPLAAPIADWLGEWTSAIGQHHERWDGEGYPDGFAGLDIPLAARIVSVADAYDVMTSARSYKKAFTAEVARNEIAKGAGSQFCPTVARAFLALPASRLTTVAGPLSWLGGLPGLRNAPVAELVGSTTATAASATLTAVAAISVIPSLVPLPAAAEPAPQPPTTVEAPATSASTTTEAPPENPADLEIAIPNVAPLANSPAAGTTTPVRTVPTTTAPPTTATAPPTTATTPSTTATTPPTTATTPSTTAPVPIAPLIDPSQVFAVAETAAVGSSVGTVLASDADSPITGFSIVGGNDDGVLSIASSGLISVADDANLDYETIDRYELTVAATDGSNVSPPVVITINVVDVIEVVADAGGPYSLDEGAMLVLDGSGSTGSPTSWNWDLDDDGQYDDATGMTPSVPWATLAALGVDDDGLFPVSLQLDGGEDSANGSLTINNVKPTLSVTGPSSINVGGLYTLDLSVTDSGEDTIVGWTINWGDGTIEHIAGNPSSVTHTYNRVGFTFNVLASATDEDQTVQQNELLVPSFDADKVFRFDADSGAFLQQFDTAKDPIETVIGPDGRLYVSGEKSDDVRRYDAETGALIDVFVAPGSGGLGSPEGLAFGPDGNLYVSNWSGNNVLRFHGTTGAFIDVFTVGGVAKPYDLLFGPDSNLYVATYESHSVRRFDGTTGAFIDTFVSPGSGGLDTPEQMAFGPDGSLYIASFNSNQILRYSGLTGGFTDIFITSGGPGGLERPTGLSFGPDGNIYVGDHANHRILRYDGATAAFIDEYIPAGTGGLTKPDPMTFLPKHQVTITP